MVMVNKGDNTVWKTWSVDKLFPLKLKNVKHTWILISVVKKAFKMYGSNQVERVPALGVCQIFFCSSLKKTHVLFWALWKFTVQNFVNYILNGTVIVCLVEYKDFLRKNKELPKLYSKLQFKANYRSVSRGS